MNLSVIALALLALQLLSNKPEKKPSIADFLSDDTKSLISCVEKLSDKNAQGSDKTEALLQMMTNPQVAEIAEKLFAKKDNLKNDEGYDFGSPSQASKDFFRPIDNVADAEVKHKLYSFYDKWYVK